MADLNRILQKFINEQISLSLSDISASSTSKDWLVGGITNIITRRFNQPKLFADKPFVNFGSYSKGTKAGFIDEIDILVVIDTYSGYYHEKGIQIAEGIGNAYPNPLFNGNYNIEGTGNISTTKLLNWLKGCINEFVAPFKIETPEKNGQAISLFIGNSRTSFDFVPACILKNEISGDIFYVIPKGDRNNGWIKTNPIMDMQLLNAVAKDKTNFKNVIRIIKFIKNMYNMKIPSFSIECNSICYSALYNWSNSLSIDFLGVLGFLQRNLNGKVILDTYDVKTNTIDGVDSLDYYAGRIGKIFEEIKSLQNVYLGDTDAYQKLLNIMYNK